jgi:hypothetical protein
MHPFGDKFYPMIIFSLQKAGMLSKVSVHITFATLDRWIVSLINKVLYDYTTTDEGY